MRPWQWPPCWIEPPDIERELAAGDDGITGRFRAAKLLQQMRALRVSRWHPDPMAAIAAAIKKDAAA